MAENSQVKSKKSHVDLRKIERYVRHKEYPKDVDTKGKKSNFRRACKKFNIVNGIFSYKGTRIVIIEKESQDVNHDIHQGLGDDVKAVALSSHYGRIATYEKIVKRFYWYTIYDDVDNFIKGCDDCQKQATLSKDCNVTLNPVPVPSEVMKQIGVDMCSLPEVDGFHYLVVAIDYFSKWSEAKPLKSKHALPVAEFLYELICRHGCFDIQINDQGREFVNEVSTALHKMTGVEQRVTSAYHPQSNGLTERKNRTIKNALVKVLDVNPEEWPSIIEGVLFAHRMSRHWSTKFSPFFLLYNRDPVLPIDLKYSDAPLSSNEEFDTEMFENVLSTAKTLRNKIHEEASSNIKQAQERQKRDYDRRHSSATTIKINEKVLLLNNKRQDRKGGKFTYRWLGPYVVKNITPKGVATLVSEKGVELKKKQNVSKLKPYVESSSNLTVVPDEKPPIQGALPRGQPLTDEELNSGQMVLLNQFPHIQSLQDPILKDVFKRANSPSIQIHHNGNFHWVCSAAESNEVYLFDSKFHKSITKSLAQQLADVHGANVVVKAPVVQQQVGGNDCGVFAMAFAVEIAFYGCEMAIRSKFDQAVMRRHFEKCLKEEAFSPFPKIGVIDDLSKNDWVSFDIGQEIGKKAPKRCAMNRQVNQSKKKRMKIEKVTEDENDGDATNINLEDFKKFLHENKDGILCCMKNTPMPITRNPFVSCQESSVLLKLLKYDDALQTMLEFITSDEDIKKMNSRRSLALQNARFEKSFVQFIQMYLDSQHNDQ